MATAQIRLTGPTLIVDINLNADVLDHRKKGSIKIGVYRKTRGTHKLVGNTTQDSPMGTCAFLNFCSTLPTDVQDEFSELCSLTMVLVSRETIRMLRPSA